MTLQIEMVSCGDCKRCLVGAKVHGPYWYSYERENGKVVSEYVGKEVDEPHADSEHPAGSTPEDLYPGRVEEMQRRASEDAESLEAALSPDQRGKLERVTSLQAGVRRATRHRAKATPEDPATAEQYQEEAARLRAELGPAKAALREMAGA